MRLSTKTRYGVRAVFDLAYHGEASLEAIQAKDIARREDIPLRYLEQIFQDLRRSGVVESKRGPRGGYLLKRPPEEISLSDIITALQGPIEDMFVQDDHPEAGAPLNSRAITTDLWKELADHVSSWFSTISVADLVSRGKDLGVPKGDGQTMYFI